MSDDANVIHHMGHLAQLMRGDHDGLPLVGKPPNKQAQVLNALGVEAIVRLIGRKVHRFAAKSDAPGAGKQTDNGVEKGRFPRAIKSEETVDPTGLDPRIQPLEYLVFAISHLDIPQA